MLPPQVQASSAAPAPSFTSLSFLTFQPDLLASCAQILPPAQGQPCREYLQAAAVVTLDKGTCLLQCSAACHSVNSLWQEASLPGAARADRAVSET